MRILLLLVGMVVVPMSAAVITEPTVTSLNGVELAATVVYEAGGEARPGLLMVPNWLGLTPAAVEQATLIASFGYVVYVADVYGSDLAPKDMDGAKVAAGTLRADRALMRARMNQHLEHFTSLAGTLPLDAERLAGIGFCFGGGCVLELARSGAAIPAVISFHGNLDTPNPADASAISASILVCHGA
jgi:dienelactone hydrolase